MTDEASRLNEYEREHLMRWLARAIADAGTPEFEAAFYAIENHLAELDPCERADALNRGWCRIYGDVVAD